MLRMFRSPHIHLGVGIVVAVTSAVEVVEEIEILAGGDLAIGAHHGMLIFGVAKALNALGHMLESADNAHHAGRRLRAWTDRRRGGPPEA